MEDPEKNKSYLVEWVDGSKSVECIFERSHRGFFIFIDKNEMKIICRPSSIKQIKEIT